MTNYYLTNKAVEDLTNIWNYTFENWSEKQADKYYEMFLDNCQEIADNPELGKNDNKVTSPLFRLQTIKHIICYRKTNIEKVEITRSIHESMNLKNDLTETNVEA